jgi:hypothetical protein
MRIPKKAPQFPPTTTTTLRKEYSDHKALLANIPQIGDHTSHPHRSTHSPPHATILPSTSRSPNPS